MKPCLTNRISDSFVNIACGLSKWKICVLRKKLHVLINERRSNNASYCSSFLSFAMTTWISLLFLVYFSIQFYIYYNADTSHVLKLYNARYFKLFKIQKICHFCNFIIIFLTTRHQSFMKFWAIISKISK